MDSIVVCDKHVDFCRFANKCIIPTPCEVSPKDLLEAEADLYLVHIDDADWKKLCKKLSTLQRQPLPWAIRFSTVVLPHTPQSYRDHGWLHCSQELGDIKEDAFQSLVDACLDPEAREELKQGLIPANRSELRNLLSFSELDTLRALHILLMGLLAAWASDSGHSHSSKAGEALGISDLPHLPSASIAKRSTWQLILNVDSSAAGCETLLKQLAEELGVTEKKLKETDASNVDPDLLKIKKLVCEITEQQAADTKQQATDPKLDVQIALDAFQVLEKVLK